MQASLRAAPDLRPAMRAGNPSPPFLTDLSPPSTSLRIAVAAPPRASRSTPTAPLRRAPLAVANRARSGRRRRRRLASRRSRRTRNSGTRSCRSTVRAAPSPPPLWTSPPVSRMPVLDALSVVFASRRHARAARGRLWTAAWRCGARGSLSPAFSLSPSHSPSAHTAPHLSSSLLSSPIM